MLFTFDEYGKTESEIVMEIKQLILFILSFEEMKQQIYLSPYIALGKSPEAVLAICESKMSPPVYQINDLPNKMITQYTNFVILSKATMLKVCELFVKSIENEKRSYFVNTHKRTK